MFRWKAFYLINLPFNIFNCITRWCFYLFCFTYKCLNKNNVISLNFSCCIFLDYLRFYERNLSDLHLLSLHTDTQFLIWYHGCRIIQNLILYWHLYFFIKNLRFQFKRSSEFWNRLIILVPFNKINNILRILIGIKVIEI